MQTPWCWSIMVAARAQTTRSPDTKAPVSTPPTAERAPVRGPAPPGACPCGGGCPRCASHRRSSGVHEAEARALSARMLVAPAHGRGMLQAPPATRGPTAHAEGRRHRSSPANAARGPPARHPKVRSGPAPTGFSGSGASLSAAERGRFEPLMGLDLGAVRVHGGAAAETLALRAPRPRLDVRQPRRAGPQRAARDLVGTCAGACARARARRPADAGRLLLGSTSSAPGPRASQRAAPARRRHVDRPRLCLGPGHLRLGRGHLRLGRDPGLGLDPRRRPGPDPRDPRLHRPHLRHGHGPALGRAGPSHAARARREAADLRPVRRCGRDGLAGGRRPGRGLRVPQGRPRDAWPDVCPHRGRHRTRLGRALGHGGDRRQRRHRPPLHRRVPVRPARVRRVDRRARARDGPGGPRPRRRADPRDRPDRAGLEPGQEGHAL